MTFDCQKGNGGYFFCQWRRYLVAFDCRKVVVDISQKEKLEEKKMNIPFYNLAVMGKPTNY